MTRIGFLLAPVLFAAILPSAARAAESEESALVIVEAKWGMGTSWVDVTQKVADMVKDGRLILPVHARAIPNVDDPSPNNIKTLKVKYSILNKLEETEAEEGGLIAIAAPIKVEAAGLLSVIEARYGAFERWVDVSKAAEQAIEGATLSLPVGNDLCNGKDPKPGIPKTAYVVYAWRGRQYVTQQAEDEKLIIDPTDVLKAGEKAGRVTRSLASMMLTSPASVRPRAKEFWSSDEIKRVTNWVGNQSFRFDALPKVKSVEIGKMSDSEQRKHKVPDGWSAIIRFEPTESEWLGVKIFEQVEPVILRGPEVYIRTAERLRSGQPVRTTGIVSHVYMSSRYIDGKTPAQELRIFLKDGDIISNLVRKP